VIDDALCNHRTSFDRIELGYHAFVLLDTPDFRGGLYCSVAAIVNLASEVRK
jgi:hypothetical protein